MQEVSRPGVAAQVHLGGNYAQPAVSFNSMPFGSDVSRIESFMGNRNASAPWTSDEARAAEKVAEVGPRKSDREHARTIVKRRYAMREQSQDPFREGSTYV
jgi:hypothetical protein